MTLPRTQIVIAVLLALAVGVAIAWFTQSPTRSTGAVRRPLPDSGSLPSPAAETRTIYKWQDADGVWNFSDLPPLDRPYSLVIGTPNVTSVPSIVPEFANPSSSAVSADPKH